jgi:hypothetical protein
VLVGQELLQCFESAVDITIALGAPNADKCHIELLQQLFHLRAVRTQREKRLIISYDYEH